jgi:multicomponent Na+:H+ antiporter subunit D
VVFGLGPAPEGAAGEEEAGSEERAPADRTPASMFIPAAALLAGTLAIGLIPGVVPAFEGAAGQFANGPAYAHALIAGGAAPAVASAEPYSAPAHAYLYSAITLAGGLAIAAATIFTESPALRGARRAGLGLMRPLRAVHSGHIGDYVAWLVLGAAGLGGAFGLAFT